jgi:hypothetical protein
MARNMTLTEHDFKIGAAREHVMNVIAHFEINRARLLPEVRRIAREIAIRQQRETFVPSWSLEDTRD